CPFAQRAGDHRLDLGGVSHWRARGWPAPRPGGGWNLWQHDRAVHFLASAHARAITRAVHQPDLLVLSERISPTGTSAPLVFCSVALHGIGCDGEGPSWRALS